jgi:predicted regulator of Ras-like GTPase activity (Roadblock/LC7/MglB family)
MNDIFDRLFRANPKVKAAMIVSTEGLPVVSALPRGIDETKMAAMTAAMLSLAKRSVIEMEKGDFEQMYIRGNEGYLLILQAGPDTVLTISTTKDVRLGLLFLDLKRFFEDFDNYPYPYIFKPPSPPGEAGAEAKLKPEYISSKKVSEITFYCKHCGAVLSNGESICHVCGKKTI